MNYDKLEEGLLKENQSNIGLKLVLKVIKTQFKDISNYPKKKSWNRAIYNGYW